MVNIGIIKNEVYDKKRAEGCKKAGAAPDPSLIERLRQDILRELESIRNILRTKYHMNPAQIERELIRIQNEANAILTHSHPELLKKENYVQMLQWFSNHYSTVIQGMEPDPKLLERLRQDILRELQTIRNILRTKYHMNPSQVEQVLLKIQNEANNQLSHNHPDLLKKENYVNMLQWFSNYYTQTIQNLNNKKKLHFKDGSHHKLSLIA